ncbi:DUF4262 domain-containing protein [Marinicella sp. W31]|uniref:DUF4262 domain-containing protein n=1 Tax=Marinicella sp. W31 TaxID=3023713 RepID=UPI00375786B3
MDTKETIEKHGWLSQFVFDEKGEKQNFAYTIGLEETFSHPEIMIFGLKKEIMHDIMGGLVAEIKAGQVFQPDQITTNALGGDFEVMFKPLKEEHFTYYVGEAERYYKKPFRVYVMFWPDRNNVLPTDAGCELDLQDEGLEIVD